MLTPPLQLERSFFTRVEVVANPNHVLGKGEVEVATTPTLGQATRDGSRWVTELDLTVAGKQGTAPPPYQIRLHTVGTFLFAKVDLTEAEKVRLLAVTGVSILYSQAREYLLTLTGRGPWGPFQLPTVSFIDARPRQEIQAPQRRQAPTANRRRPQRPSTARRRTKP